MRYSLNEDLQVIDYGICMYVNNRKTKKAYKLDRNKADLLIAINNQSNEKMHIEKSQNDILEKLQSLEIVMQNKKHRKVLIRQYNKECGLDVIQLEITKRCNFNCSHCYLGEKESYNDMDTEKIFKIVDEASALGVQEFNITGGEPLLHKDIKKILKYIEQRGMATRLYTNGFLLNDEFIDFLNSIHIMCVRISVDGLDEKTHDEIRKVKSYRCIEINIEKLLKKGITVEISTTTMRTNLHEVPEIIKKYSGKDNLRHIVDTYLPGNVYDILKVNEREYVEAIKSRFEPFCNKCSNAVKKHCGIADNYMFIDSKGIAKLCPTLPTEYDLGNVCQSGIKAIWMSKKIKVLDLECEKKKDCEFAAICDGGCRSRALYNYDAITAPDYYMCELYKYLKSINYVTL